MPSTSKSQQRLFCMAYAVRKGKLKRSEADKSVIEIADSDMSDEELKKFMKLKESMTESEIDTLVEKECESCKDAKEKKSLKEYIKGNMQKKTKKTPKKEEE